MPMIGPLKRTLQPCENNLCDTGWLRCYKLPGHSPIQAGIVKGEVGESTAGAGCVYSFARSRQGDEGFDMSKVISITVVAAILAGSAARLSADIAVKEDDKTIRISTS